MNELIERVANYCKKMSGQDMPIKAFDKQLAGKLPLAITGAYHCYESQLMGVPIILMEVRNDDYTPKQLQKHQAMMTRLIGKYAVFIMNHVKSYHLSRMVDGAVNFIIPDKLMYVPSLLINLREVKDGRRLADELMPGIAQCILLYHLQRGSLNGWTTKHLAEKFCTSYASMSRALRWLSLKGLIRLTGEKEKTVVMAAKGKSLWEKAFPLMLSPVERVLYTDELLEEMPLAGESALEQITMLAAPERPCKAVSKVWAQKQKGLLHKNFGDCMVEVWRYDPMLLAEKNIVDSLSLYLSLQTNDDERIKIELKKIINNVIWLED